MNFEQEGGVTIPKQLDSSDLKASQGLGKVLTRLNYIFRDADQNIEEVMHLLLVK